MRCAGARLGLRHCLGHLTDNELAAVIRRLRSGTKLDARGVTVTEPVMAKLLRLLESPETRRPELPAVDFGDATFSGDIDFRRATFLGHARFSGATFVGRARLRGCVFKGRARFRGTVFEGEARFSKAVFEQSTFFGEARFQHRASFREARAGEHISFLRACFLSDAVFADFEFGENAKFNEAKFQGVTFFSRARFRKKGEFFFVEFAREVDARQVRFFEDARFDNARFLDELRFDEAVFTGKARFSGRFGGASNFVKAEFHGVGSFDGLRFGGRGDFSNVTFLGTASFSGVRFEGPAKFGGVTFSSHAQFDGAVFGASTRFSGSVFGGDTRFSEVRCEEDARFKNVQFERTRALGSLTVGGGLFLDGAVFGQHVRLELVAGSLSARGATFAEGVYLQIEGSSVLFEDADFVRQSVIVGVDGDEHGPPRLLSLRRAHVAPLVLSRLDLRPCRFLGAHGLESMQAEESCIWPVVPKRWRLSKRQVIAEEHQWRAEQADGDGCSQGWGGAETRWPSGLEGSGEGRVLDPPEIASIYRALRKAREDAKDEAGAGDLYYGEMEMRRGSRPQVSSLTASAESAVLGAYWLISGYGLRASRALLALALAIAIAAALFCWFGFHPSAARNYGRACLFTLETSLNLLRPPRASLTVGGEVVQVIMRLLGPLLFGLALLALRARVKR